MNTVELNQVSKAFGKRVAVADLSFAVPPGSIWGIIGPNGSGKTTTLRILMSIFFPDSGRVRILGQPASRTLSERIGYLPEERGLYRGMKVRETLLFYGGLRTGRRLTREADLWLERFGIRDWADHRVETLSKGMHQKVQFLATVVSDPQVLVLDEPFSGLDPVNAEMIKRTLLEMRQAGATILLSTHDMHTAETMCDHLLMIYRGRKVLDGTLAAIQGQYGQDTIRVQTTDGKQAAVGLPGVERVHDLGQLQELLMEPHANPQEILKHLVARTAVLRFEVARPSLQDIFVRIAKPEPEEAAHV